MENLTDVTHFILLGLTNTPELKVPLLILFTLIYLVNLVGNFGMVLLIILDSHLHTPMYFFLSNLSFVDIVYSTTVIPTIMTGLLVGNRAISYNACATQMFFFAAFATIESYILAAMAYDRYAAVCRPLHYTTTMTKGTCAGLTAGSYFSGFVIAIIHVQEIFSLSFCSSNVIHHFFCDAPAVLALACSDRFTNEMVLVYVDTYNIFIALIIILISYVFIFMDILKMSSSTGYQKTLSTCASHLTAITIFYGTVIFMYLLPSSSHSMDTDKVAAVFYTVVIPMLNPMVYSLRNKEVKNAFKKVVQKAKLSLVF